jgi:peptide/nickel transport system permease protein
MGISMVFALMLAIPIGIYSAIRQYSWFDHASTGFSYFGYSMPIFWFGLMLQLFFAYYLYKWTGVHWFYSANMYSVGHEHDIINRLQHLALPVMTLSIASIAGWSRYQRASMLEVINSDYLRTARAKGLPERTVILKHALRNAMIPLITILTLDIAALFSGAVVTETVFGWPGMGRLFYDAVVSRDYPVVMGCVMLFSVMVIIFNLIADILYAVFDPRIRYD